MSDADQMRKLGEECDKRGLPHDVATLVRHLENNHQAALGCQRDISATWKARARRARPGYEIDDWVLEERSEQ